EQPVNEGEGEVERLGVLQQVREHLRRSRHRAGRGGVHPRADLRRDLVEGGDGRGGIVLGLRGVHRGQRSVLLVQGSRRRCSGGGRQEGRRDRCPRLQ